jgi:hypothetical protein
VKRQNIFKVIALCIVMPVLMVGCATTEPQLADGRNVRAVMAAQIEDAAASDRHGTAAPQGTDSEVSAASVKALRQRGAEGASKPGFFESLFGAIAGK